MKVEEINSREVTDQVRTAQIGETIIDVERAISSGVIYEAKQ